MSQKSCYSVVNNVLYLPLSYQQKNGREMGLFIHILFKNTKVTIYHASVRLHIFRPLEKFYPQNNQRY